MLTIAMPTVMTLARNNHQNSLLVQATLKISRKEVISIAVFRSAARVQLTPQDTGLKVPQWNSGRMVAEAINSQMTPESGTPMSPTAVETAFMVRVIKPARANVALVSQRMKPNSITSPAPIMVQLNSRRARNSEGQTTSASMAYDPSVIAVGRMISSAPEGDRINYSFAFRDCLVVGFILRSALTIEITCLWMRKNYLWLR